MPFTGLDRCLAPLVPRRPKGPTDDQSDNRDRHHASHARHGRRQPDDHTSQGLLTDGLYVSFSGLAAVNAGSIDSGANSYGIEFLTAGSVTNQETVRNVGGLSAINLGGPTGWSTGKRDDQVRDDLPALFSPTYWIVS
jgi:hypothetical protein